MSLHSNRTWFRIMLVAVAIGVVTEESFAQFGGGGPSGGQPLLPGNRRKKPELQGLSLSATGEEVVELRIVGNKTISTSQITNQLQTRAGRPFDPKIVQRDVRKLASLTWFVDVKPLYEQTPAGRIVIFQVVERPTIRYLEFLGNRRIRDKTLAKEIGLKAGGSVDPFAVEDGRRKLLALYKRNGFNNSQVTVNEGSKATDQGVVYVINEGQSQRIAKIKFVGVDFVSPRRLKTRIESKPPTMMFIGGFVDHDKIEADVQRITDYYRAFGFYQAKVGHPIVEFNGAETRATITFVVHEGPRYAVRNVRFIGNQLFREESLAMGITLPAGLPYERSKMRADIEWLKELYGSQGYVFADVRAEQVLLEEPGQLDLVYHLDEGKRWRVGRILVNIAGDHPHSRIQTALNRLSLQPGEVIDIREVRASERRLQASGLFLSDPVQGVTPKITFQIPELEFAGLGEPGGRQLRGQSPDSAAATRPVSAAPVTRTYEVRRPTGYENNEFVDVVLEIGPPAETPGATEDSPPPAMSTETRPTQRAPADTLSPTAQRHVVHRHPLDGPSPYGQTQFAQQQFQARSTSQQMHARRPVRTQPSVPSDNSAYRSLVVRTQSPFQPAPVPARPPVAQGYGGQLPGATGPQSAPVQYGRTSGPVQPAQYAEPLPPPAGAVIGPSPATSAPGQPVFNPPQYPITPIPGGPPVSPYAPGNAPWMEPAVDVIVDVAEAPTGRFQIGAGINSDAGVTGTILLDERNFDWRRPPTSWNDFATGRAWRGAGQRFRLEAAPGTRVQRYLASFQEPYLFDSAISLGLSGSFFDRRYRDWDEQRLGGRVSLGYQWVQHDLSTTISYRGENVNIHDAPNAAFVPELQEVLGDNSLHGFRWGITNDTRDSAFFPTEGHLIDFGLEQVVGSFEYPRATIDIREYGLLFERPDHSGRHILTASTQLGFTGQDTPIYEHFFAGGYSTIRGFDFRGASPVFNGVEVGGQFMWINSIEYLFPLTADDMIHGVVFVDAGTVERNVQVDLDRVRIAPGLGLRLTIPAMGPAPIALDFAWAVRRASTDDLQVFSFNVGFTR